MDQPDRPPAARPMMPPAVPAGPRPPRPAGFSAEFMADLDRRHAAVIRAVAQRMLWGERAADVTATIARQTWPLVAGRDPSPFDVEHFRWLRQLGETPDTPEGVVTLLRLADMTEWQTFDQVAPNP